MENEVRVFLVGAGGFIGRRVLTQLSSMDLGVRSYVRRDEQRWLEDHTSFAAGLKKQLTDFEPSVIINLANHFSRGFPKGDIEASLEANVTIPLLLSDYSSEQNVRYIHLGSYWQLPYFASNPRMQSLYLYTKKLASDLIFSDPRLCTNSQEILIPDTFGQGDMRDKLIPAALASKSRNEIVTLTNPNSRMYLVSADSVARYLAKIVGEDLETDRKKFALMASLELSTREVMEILNVAWVARENREETQSTPDFRSLLGDYGPTYIETTSEAMSRLSRLT